MSKDCDAGKDWRQEEKGMAEDKMVGRPHWFNGPTFGQAPRDGDGQGSLVCYSQQGCKELDTTEWLNNNNHACEDTIGYMSLFSQLPHYTNIYPVENWKKNNISNKYNDSYS